MQIQFKATNYELGPEMTDLATKKLLSLRKYLGKNDRPVYIYADLGKTSEAHQNGEVWFTELNLDMEGTRYNVRATAESLRSAIDKASGELGEKLKTEKNKRESTLKKSGARIKDFFRFGRDA
ncbi:MAG: HPF/RaiA family ribosome-associated protein [Patescibacteria group bacterium]